VRMALGGSPRQVVGRVLRQGLATTAIGVATGVVAALGLTRTFQSLLFEVTPTDPVAFAAVIGVLAAVATLACYAPASRASRVDPIEALRQD